jgi:uncharacterized protein
LGFEGPTNTAHHKSWDVRIEIAVTPTPLTEEEFDRLSSMLEPFGDRRSMNLEQLDGFLAALICGPEIVPPSEYLPVIWGDNILLEGTSTVADFLSLVMRHWNTIVGTLRAGDIRQPLLLADERGVVHANDWAKGFVRGMEFNRADWADLLDDEEHGGSLIPILALTHEHDPDPEMRPYSEPMSEERRERLTEGAAAGVIGIYRYFHEHRCMKCQSVGASRHLPVLCQRLGATIPVSVDRERNSSSALPSHGPVQRPERPVVPRRRRAVEH